MEIKSHASELGGYKESRITAHTQQERDRTQTSSSIFNSLITLRPTIRAKINETHYKSADVDNRSTALI